MITSEPDAVYSSTNFTCDRCLLRRGIPQELPPRAARPAGAFTAKLLKLPQKRHIEYQALIIAGSVYIYR